MRAKRRAIFDSGEMNRVFHALGDPTRRLILERISEGEISVSTLAAPLKITLAAVVQHLQILERGRLIRTTKVGRTRRCSMETYGWNIVQQWITYRRADWENRFDRLGKLLSEDMDTEKQ